MLFLSTGVVETSSIERRFLNGFVYVLFLIYPIFIARKISDKTVFEIDQSFIVFVKQLSCCNRKLTEKTAKACASLVWADSWLPCSRAELCSFLFIVCQAYFSFCRVLWLSHLVQCVHLPRWSLPNIRNLIKVQDLQGVRCKMEFYQIKLNGSDWKCWQRSAST